MADPAKTSAPIFPAPCPQNGCLLIDNGKTLDCETGCGFPSLWREQRGTTLTDAELEALLKDGRTPLIDRFVSKQSGKKYSAVIVLGESTNYKPHLEFAPREPRTEPSVEPFAGAECPVCQGPLVAIGGDNPAIGCEKIEGNKRHFMLWRSISKRALSDEEARTLIRDRALPEVDGFVGSKGRFKAGLKFKEGFIGTEFVFAPREPKPAGDSE